MSTSNSTGRAVTQSLDKEFKPVIREAGGGWRTPEAFAEEAGG